MRIVDIREVTVPISRYADPDLPSGGLTTSVVSILTDVSRNGRPVVGYGFASFGRYGQGGLIRERFASRILNADTSDLADTNGTNIDPFRVWATMMNGEKPGGHGERCVAVGTLDMAIWDAASKIAGLPLHRYLTDRTGRAPLAKPSVSVYAGGGYYYPKDDIKRLEDEVRAHLHQGYVRVKIKIAGAPLNQDINRVETVLRLLPSAEYLAVDAMNAYDRENALTAATALAPYGLRWFEDICDPLDFDLLATLAGSYKPPIAAGEALFSVAEAKLLLRHGGLRSNKDILLFDPVHCYGLTNYLKIIELFEQEGWPRTAFWPHGGHLFSLHIACALGLGGSEMNPLSFQPFGGLADGSLPAAGAAAPPEAPGIGLETKANLLDLLPGLGQ